MVKRGDNLTVHDGERLTVRVATAELFEVEAELRKVDKPAPLHFHPSQDEHFEVLEGELTVKLSDGERTVSAGQTIDIPRRTAHTMFNAGDEPVRMIWQTRPAQATGEFFATLDERHRPGRMPGLRDFGHVLHRHRAEIRLAGVPDVLQRPLVALLASLP